MKHNPADPITANFRQNYFDRKKLEDSIAKNKIFTILLNLFQSDEWPYQIIDKQSLIRLIFNGNNGGWVCYANAREEAEQFIFYSLLSFKVPENKRQLIAEFITRVNYGILIGNFDWSCFI
ncbi:MAG: YbjN domain-containing protein [Rivularia sp. ALOHA_DT_140]|nr:YbjN domain-containing protein [Rivularia sp. ALOHA_DT_140]